MQRVGARGRAELAKKLRSLATASVAAFTVWWRGHSGWLSHRWLRIAWLLVLLLGGAFLFSRLAGGAEWRRAWSTGVSLGPALLVLLALPAVSHFIKMLGWRALLPRQARPSLATAYATFVAAQGVNELGFSVMGEPLKVLVLAPTHRAAGIKAAVADNLAALAALFAVIGTLARLGLGALPVLLLALMVLARAKEQSWSGLLAAFVAHYLGKLWLVVEIGLGLQLLGESALPAARQLSLACLGAAALGAPVPGQLGIVEVALTHTGSLLGIAAPSLLALALIRRLRSLLWLLLGLLLAARIVHTRPLIRASSLS